MPPSIATALLVVTVQPLTQSNFASFGDVIENPLDHNVNTIPSVPPTAFKPANQNTALKASPVSGFQNKYQESHSHAQGRLILSMFACFPRSLDRDTADSPSVFKVRILERHPFTTQTFIPMGLSPGDPLTKYLVVVAPTLPTTASFPHLGPPDLNKVRAFVAQGRQAVTYGAGTWHAPMVVVGEKRIDFVVVQSMNGIAEDDCQEVEINGEVSVLCDKAMNIRNSKL